MDMIVEIQVTELLT